MRALWAISALALMAACDQAPQPKDAQSSSKDSAPVAVESSPPLAPRPAPSPAPEPLPERAKISWAQFQAVSEGASFDAVQKALGQTGELNASQDIDGQVVKTYSFGDTSQGAIVVVSKGHVISKMPGLMQAE